MSSGNIIHLGGCRPRIVSGNGTLIITTSDMNTGINGINTQVMTGPSEIFKIANVMTQKGKIRFETKNQDEIFQISQIIVYYKPVWTQFPQ